MPRFYGPALGVVIASLAPNVIAAQPASSPGSGFEHRGFYLHGGWFFKYPFAVRMWKPADYRGMFSLLREMGFDRVMIWPMLESIPAPLSPADAAALKGFGQTIEDAHRAGLECWLTLCPNLLSPLIIASRPWSERNPYPIWKSVRLDNAAESKDYLAHRSAMLALLNNADAYVTIDGDPGGYADARPQDWVKVLRSDRETIDRFGIAPQRQKVIPWIWCGWGTRGVWQEPIAPFIQAELEAIEREMPGPCEYLIGRSHDEKHANGRTNVELADRIGVIRRSTLLCYEAIEFEPTPPAGVLQFDIIRKVLRREGVYAPMAQGVFGNAQQPIMVLPNLYFFARAAADLRYLDRAEEQVLADFADLLGGPADVLAPAWSCLRLDLEHLPDELPARLRAIRLSRPAARFIPGGPERYLDLLAMQVESRRGLLKAVSAPGTSTMDAARRAAAGVQALVDWWNIHRFVFDGSGDEPFSWRYVHPTQVDVLRQWCRSNLREPATIDEAARLLVGRGILPIEIARARLAELVAE